MMEKTDVRVAAAASCFLAFAIVFGSAHGQGTYSLAEPVISTAERLTCPCGETEKNAVLVETSLDALEGVCLKFEKCKTCAAGLDRCLTCPPDKHGSWCEKDCSCRNGGACTANGSCSCQNGFDGKKCEVVIQPRRYNYRRRRQGSDSPGGCHVFPPPENGNLHLEASSPKAGDAIKYTCRENYTMMGSRTRHCNTNGHWTGEAPTCEKMCPFPSVSQHVKVKVNPYHLGSPLHDTFGAEVLSELEFYCQVGYTLVGAQRIRCASGIWDQQIPFCRQSSGCEDPGVPENGSRKQTKDTYKPGNQIQYECNRKHVLVGSATITCLPTAQWSSSLPVCIPDVIPTCVFSCKSQEIQAKLRQLDGPLVCDAEGMKNLKEGSIVLTPEK